MAWRPHLNLLDGELSNGVPGKVIGWMRIFRSPRVRNARGANAEQAETAVTPHVSAEIVALAVTN